MNVNNKSTAGFSLVELMVVVAIIGVLAVVAVPNYMKFQAKAKQSEAKVLLAGIYTAEKAYYVEKNQYSDLMVGAAGTGIGFQPDNSLYYNVGFNGKLEAVPGSAATKAWGCAGTLCRIGTTDVATTNKIDNSTAGGEKFIAGAVGTVTSTGTGTDAWTINETRTLVNSTTGL